TMCLDRAQQVPKRDFPLTSHDEVCRDLRGRAVCLWRQTGVVAANHNVRRWPEPTYEINDFQGRSSLERHHGKSHDVGCVLPDELLDRFSHALLNQDE